MDRHESGLDPTGLNELDMEPTYKQQLRPAPPQKKSGSSIVWDFPAG